MKQGTTSPVASLRGGSRFSWTPVRRGWRLGVWMLLLTSLAYGQSGADPAVQNLVLQPTPIPGGVGSALTISLEIGNAGTTAISGSNFANQMRFTLSLSQCAPNGPNALSGSILNAFDITYDATRRIYRGTQKTNVAIDPSQFLALSVSTVVTVASSSTAIDDIGAVCNIQPNPTANPQPAGNDFASAYTHTVASPMPVGLLSFTAQAQPDRTVLLDWKTGWEKANKGFVVERSTDLLRFEELGTVTDVSGTTQQASAYRFIDPAPYRGRSYYRLRQIDQDGSVHIFPAQSVVIDGVYGVYPNPIRADGFRVSVDEPATAVLQLLNAGGQRIEFSRRPVSETAIELSPTDALSPGIYVLTVEERATRRSYRLVAH